MRQRCTLCQLHTHDWIHQQYVPLVDIWWKLCVENLRLVHSFIVHDEHLANTHGTTAVSKAALHRLTYSNYSGGFRGGQAGSGPPLGDGPTPLWYS